MTSHDIKELIQEGYLHKAVLAAAKFKTNNASSRKIKRAANALKNPEFYKQIKQDPMIIIAEGVAEVISKWGD
jgi:hypothetical protein